MSDGFEVVVVGGGPAGSTAALALARAGCRVLVIERESFPRFHIGESMLPVSNAVFDRLGVRAAVESAGFVVKWGASFVDPLGRRTVTYDFVEQGGRTDAQTWQVPRAEFDALMLRQAGLQGATIRTGTVQSVAFDKEGVDLQVESGGRSERLRAGFLIDASGRAGLVARTLGLRHQDPQLKKAAVYAHFRGVPRPAGRRAGDVRIVSTSELGWFWLIPLPGDVMSAGIVTDLSDYEQAKGELASRGDGGKPEALLDYFLKRSPAMVPIMAKASRISPVHVESSYSYWTDAYAGDRWAMAGDAGGFLDPVFSSGVLLAMLAGTDAGEAALAVVRGEPRARSLLVRYDRVQKRRFWFMRRFVRAFYTQGVRDLFFAPRPWFGLVRAVTGVLAGDWQPSLMNRLRIRTFFTLGRVQQRWPIAPRLHPARRRVPAAQG